MPDKQVSSHDTCLVIDKVVDLAETVIFKLGREKYIRSIEHAVAFAEHQFGKRIACQTAYVRSEGDRLSNWDVKIDTLYRIYR
jgi:hypothetical protein